MDFVGSPINIASSFLVEISVTRELHNGIPRAAYVAGQSNFPDQGELAYREVNVLGKSLSAIPGVIQATISRYAVHLRYGKLFEGDPIGETAAKLIGDYLAPA